MVQNWQLLIQKYVKVYDRQLFSDFSMHNENIDSISIRVYTSFQLSETPWMCVWDGSVSHKHRSIVVLEGRVTVNKQTVIECSI